MGSSLSQKLITAGLSMAVGFVAGKAAELGWKAVTGQAAPQDDDGTASLVSVVAFAAVSAAIAAGAHPGGGEKKKWQTHFSKVKSKKNNSDKTYREYGHTAFVSNAFFTVRSIDFSFEHR